MKVPLVLALLVGCKDSSDMFPINPGGGGGPGGINFNDAAVADDGGDGGTAITGRVCVVADPLPLSCAGSGAAGLTVMLGTETATTSDDGSFVIVRPSGTDLVWRVSGTPIKSSAMPLGTSHLIPAIDATTYDTMATSVSASPSDSALLARVRKAGVALAGATATVGASTVYYDGTAIDQWATDMTGTYGVVWAPSVPTGTATLSVDDQGTAHDFAAIRIYADTVTFYDAAF